MTQKEDLLNAICGQRIECAQFYYEKHIRETSYKDQDPTDGLHKTLLLALPVGYSSEELDKYLERLDEIPTTGPLIDGSDIKFKSQVWLENGKYMINSKGFIVVSEDYEPVPNHLKPISQHFAKQHHR